MLVEIIQNVAIISFAAVGLYFINIRTSNLASLKSRLLVGLVFFLIAFLATLSPIKMPDGATIDARAGPVIVASLIGGPLSGFIAATGGAIARSIVGGAFSFSGSLVFFFYATAGSILYYSVRHQKADAARMSAGTLSVAIGLSLICAALMYFFISPVEMAQRWIANDYPFIAIANALSVAMSGLTCWIALRASDDTKQLRSTINVLNLAKKAGQFGIWQWDPSTETVTWDDRNFELHRVNRDAFSGTYSDWSSAVHPDDLDRIGAAFQALIERNEPFHVDYRVTGPDDVVTHLKGDGIAVRDASGSVLSVVGINTDMTGIMQREAQLIAAHDAEKKATAQIQYDAMHDALTDLHNRRALDMHMRHLASNSDVEAEIAFLQVDLDRFKSINDAFGHKVGDYVLAETGRMLAALQERHVFSARLGGDEFCLVLDGPNSLERAKAAAHVISRWCNQPLQHKNLELHFGASIGIALGAPEDLDQLSENADIALYVAKRSIAEDYVVFDHEMRREAERHKSIADGLRVALQKDQIVVYFQPKLFAEDRAFAGLEALVRWHHPTLGIIAPNDFLPVAEEIGLQHEIDRRVLQLTWETAHRLHAAGIWVPQIAVNIGLQRLQDPLLLADLDGMGPLPCQLVFEILETIDLDAVHRDLKWVLDGLRARGVKIVVDDFGTGYASITSLLSLQPDGLKLDRTLIAGVNGMQVPSEDLLRALVDIGRASQIAITAEGIETEHQAQLLERLGCEELQGYLFAKPMSENDLVDWLEDRSTGLPHTHRSTEKLA